MCAYYLGIYYAVRGIYLIKQWAQKYIFGKTYQEISDIRVVRWTQLLESPSFLQGDSGWYGWQSACRGWGPPRLAKPWMTACQTFTSKMSHLKTQDLYFIWMLNLPFANLTPGSNICISGAILFCLQSHFALYTFFIYSKMIFIVKYVIYYQERRNVAN